MKLIKVKDDFPPGFCEALGRLVIASGRVEYEIMLARKTLSGKGFSQGMVEAASIKQFSMLCSETMKLAEQKLSAVHCAKFTNLIDKALSIARERNDNIHALWTTDEQGHPLRIRPCWNKKAATLEWLRPFISVTQLEAQATTLFGLYDAIHSARKLWPKF